MQITRDAVQRLLHGKGVAITVTGTVFVATAVTIATYGWLYGMDVFAASALPATLGKLGFVAGLVFVVCPLAIIGLTVIARIACGIAAGRELFWLPNLEVSVSTSPDFLMSSPLSLEHQEVQMWTVPRRGRVAKHIRHSLYDELPTLGYIQAWLGLCLRGEAGAATPEAPTSARGDAGSACCVPPL
jgi:hypothetical protein